MPDLSREQLDRIRGALDARRRELLDDVRVQLEDTGNQRYEEIIGRAPADAGDASQSDELADLNLSMLDRHVSELRAIEGAEARMNDGTYGTCEQCGGDIAYERLLAFPTAIRCVRCQAQWDRTHSSQPTPTL